MLYDRNGRILLGYDGRVASAYSPGPRVAMDRQAMADSRGAMADGPPSGGRWYQVLHYDEKGRLMAEYVATGNSPESAKRKVAEQVGSNDSQQRDMEANELDGSRLPPGAREAIGYGSRNIFRVR